MSGCEIRRAGGAGVWGASSFRGAFSDCASFIDRGLNVQSTLLYPDAALDEALEEESGDLFGAALLDLVAAGEVEEGLAGLGEGGEEGAELGPSTRLRINSLGGATSVLEGVEVAGWGAGAGASATPTGTRTVAMGLGHEATSAPSVGVRGGRSKGEGAGTTGGEEDRSQGDHAKWGSKCTRRPTD